MANKSISQLAAATQINNADLFVLEQGGVAKKLSGTTLTQFLNAHGGIASTSYTAPVPPSLQGTLTLTFVDGTSASVPIMNGADGATGQTGAAGADGYSPTATVSKSGSTTTITVTDQNGTTTASVLDGTNGTNGADGNPGYCWIKYSSVEPTSDADMGDVPDAWMGVYSGSSSTAPTAYTAYKWYNIKGAQGDRGITGMAGARGTYIFQSNHAVRGSGLNQYFLKSDLYAPTTGTWSALRGDLIISGDAIYYANGTINGDPSDPQIGVYEGTRFVLQGLPTGGTTNQVLAKSSDNDYDVTWRDAGGGIYTVTYGSTSYGSMFDAEFEGKTLSLTYSGRRYTVSEVTGALASGSYTFTCTDDDGTVYWCKAEADGMSLTTTWTNGSIAPGGGTPYDSNPAALGTASPGSSNAYARGDHVHAMPTAANVGAVAVAQGSGNAGKFLVVGSDGNVTTVTMTAWQGGSY